MTKQFAALLVYIVFWASLFLLTGTLTSGYHLSDDHEVVTFRIYMNEHGFLETYEKAMKEDLVMRFRPFYYFHRVILVAIFGTKFILWSIQNAILVIFTSYLLFLFLYRQGISFLRSLIFPFLTLIGAQTAIWWRLGPNEAIGMFLYSLSLFLLVNSIKARKKYQLVISLLCLFLASLSKESFLIIIPAYLLILIYIEFENKTQTILKILTKNLFVFIVSFLFLALVLYIIIRYVGTHSIGYAGIDKTTPPGSYLNFIFSDLGRNKYFKLIYWGIGILTITYIFKRFSAETIRKKIPSYLFLLLIFLSIIIPQYVLYFKSGLWERYLIPLNLGFAILIIFLAEEISIKSKFLAGIYLLFVLLTVIKFFRSDTLDAAKSFASTGKDTNRYFSTILSNTEKEDTILMVLDVISGYEWGFSCKSYLSANNRDNIRFYMYEIPPKDEVEAGTKRNFLAYFSAQMVDTITDRYSCVAVIPFKEQDSIINSIDSLFANTFKKNEINKFTVFTSKN